MFTIVQCRCCGLVFVNPRLPEEHIKGLYDKAYFDGQGFDPYISLEEEAQKIAGVTRVPERISAVKLPPADVLEAGPGGGHFLRLAKERGFSAVGLELSNYAGNRLRQQALHILQGTIARAGIPDHAYDVIVAVEVIEHLPDPRTFFMEVARVLRPGDHFYYETGDIDCEQAREQGADWDYIRPEGHLYYFSPRTLARYLRETGFRVCYPLWFNPSRRIVSLLRQVGLVKGAEPCFQGRSGALARRLLAPGTGFLRGARTRWRCDRPGTPDEQTHADSQARVSRRDGHRDGPVAGVDLRRGGPCVE
ncbi:MAG: class I SAM-dependent methyltransferase [Nitrospirota bacterium]|nr:class I SAM-dependent methyltransferase [Nitrospirota bacterium]